MSVLEEKMITLDRSIKSRTLYGTITFVLLIVSMTLFGYFNYLVSNSIMVALGFISWIMVISVSLIRLFIVKKSYKINGNILTVKESLKHKLSTVESEIQFYQSIVKTILAPMGIGFVLIPMGIINNLPPNSSVWPLTLGGIVLFILCCYLSNQYNQYYIAKNLTPIKEDITANLKALSEGGKTIDPSN